MASRSGCHCWALSGQAQLRACLWEREQATGWTEKGGIAGVRRGGAEKGGERRREEKRGRGRGERKGERERKAEGRRRKEQEGRGRGRREGEEGRRRGGKRKAKGKGVGEEESRVAEKRREGRKRQRERKGRARKVEGGPSVVWGVLGGVTGHAGVWGSFIHASSLLLACRQTGGQDHGTMSIFGSAVYLAHLGPPEPSSLEDGTNSPSLGRKRKA